MEFRSRKILKRLDPINISSFCISVSACKREVRFIFKDPNINISITFACRLLFIRGVEIEYLLDSLEKIIHERSREYFSRVKTRLRWVILRFFLRNRNQNTNLKNSSAFFCGSCLALSDRILLTIEQCTIIRKKLLVVGRAAVIGHHCRLHYGWIARSSKVETGSSLCRMKFKNSSKFPATLSVWDRYNHFWVSRSSGPSSKIFHRWKIPFLRFLSFFDFQETAIVKI